MSGYDVSGGDNVVRVRSLMRSVSVRLEDDLKYRIIDKVLSTSIFCRPCRSSTEEAATKIQAIFRGHSTRKSLKRRTY